MRRGSAAALGIAPALASAACGSSAALVGGDPLTLRTPQGDVHGTSVDGARAFEGVPFAALDLGTTVSVATGMKAAPCAFWASTGWKAADKLAPLPTAHPA
jgi:hypothetical protein